MICSLAKHLYEEAKEIVETLIVLLGIIIIAWWAAIKSYE
jgi:hypothetical protein